MKRLFLLLIVLAFMIVQADAAMLSIVNVSAPAINCVFNPACRVVVNDSTAQITLPGTSGSGFLQTRTFKGEPGSPAAGLYVYEYRIDLTNLVGITHLPSVTSFSINFGPLVNSLDFNKDGKTGDQVFVVTSGGLGDVAPISALQTETNVTFKFDPTVAAGSANGKGHSTYFFGMVSTKPPKPVNARITINTGTALTLAARAPGL